jgi:hypothetical protein
MALITHGSFAEFSVEATPRAQENRELIHYVDNFGSLSEVSTETPEDSFRFPKSQELRGLTISSIRLNKGFQNFLVRLFRGTSDIYFVAWCWDFSGNQIARYPANSEKPDSCLIPMRGGELREFIGTGAVLFPARPVTAGLAVRVQVWESEKGTRDFGKAMAAVSKQIQESKLNSLLSLIATSVDVTTATVALIEQAALELGEAVGTALQAVSDDYVDFYEGYYPASTPWSVGKESYKGADSEITLGLFS